MDITKAITLGMLLAEAAAKGIAVAQEGKAMVERMVAEQRDPTPAELDHLRSVTKTLHDLVQAG